MCSLILLSGQASASESREELLKLHEEFIANENGRSYANLAVGQFWGDISFMRQCAPPDSPVPESFDIFYIVTIDGAIESIHLFPETKTGKCIKENVKTRAFNKPPTKFVGHIEMEFTP